MHITPHEDSVMSGFPTEKYHAFVIYSYTSKTLGKLIVLNERNKRLQQQTVSNGILSTSLTSV